MGLIIGTTVLALLSIGIVGGYAVLRMRAGEQEPLDKATLCPLSGPRAITAILLDVTDPIADATATDLRNEFQAIVDQVPTGGLVQVYLLTEKEGELAVSFSGCNPGSGKDVDEWTNNPRLAQDRWERGFQKPLEELSKRLRDGKAGQQSPIMAGIQKINLEAFGLPKYQSLPRTLVVASDMVEHTAAFSIYRTGASYPKYEQSGAQAKFRTPLNGINVRVLEFQRPGLRFSDQELGNFWNSWVSNNSGTLGSFKRLQGIL
ncbi:Hypothetical protein NGAL_HAMBI490_58520 [Neorhizobium galegae bv. officinalis]|nr:Hypothetical protein NGAL_HAMBI490_58520 [Neorhizobium galegae bv. officinalis]